MSGWVIGFIVGGVVALVVVVLLLLMIAGARRVAAKAEAILAALIEARDNTRGLWAVSGTNMAATRIVAAATTAREALAGEKGTR
jgi:hypothetical protein